MKDYTNLLTEDTSMPDLEENNEGEEYAGNNVPEQAQKYIDMSDEELDALAAENPEENMNILSEEDLERFMQNVSRAKGNTVSFQAYNYDSPEDDPDRFDIQTVSDCSFFMVKNMAYTDLLQVDLSFRTPHDPDLKKLWSALKRHLRSIAKFPNNRWIFFIKVENDSDTYVQMINPIMFYLTRSEPEIEAEDEEVNGMLQGGNMIRFLFARDSVIFGTLDENDYQKTSTEE